MLRTLDNCREEYCQSLRGGCIQLAYREYTNGAPTPHPLLKLADCEACTEAQQGVYPRKKAKYQATRLHTSNKMITFADGNTKPYFNKWKTR